MQRLVELSGFSPFFVDVCLKAVAVLGMAWLLALVLSWCRKSAASRHAVWAIATACVLVLPVMTAILPSWRIAIPWQSAATLTRETPAFELVRGGLPSAQIQVEQPSLAPTVESQFARAAPQVSAVQLAASLPERSNSRLANSPKLPWQCYIWSLGASLTLAPAALGFMSLWRLGRRSRAVKSGPLSAALQQAKEQLGVNAPVRLLESGTRAMPMTWGIWRPTILLPQEAHHWSSEGLRIVLLHELAHFQRGDCLTQLLAQISRAIYWFNPLAWMAERQLRILQEQACDDLVLARGLEAADYAEHLLAVSAGYRSLVCAGGLALAMAQSSKLERRLLLILDPYRNRQPLARPRFRMAVVAAVTFLPLLSAMRFEANAVAQEQATQNAEPQQPTTQPTDSAKTLADLRAKITEQYFAPVDEKEIVQGAIRGMVDALRDPYSDYLTADMVADIEKQIGGSLVGIGAQLEMHEGKVRVVTPLEDSPALKAGIRPGDVILQIDGMPTAGIELTEAVKRIVGPQGSSVRLKIGREGAPEVELSITRSPIQLKTVRGFQRGADNRWAFLLDPAQKIGYAQLVQLGSTTPQELRNTIESLKAQGLKGLILDLRFCPGGTLESAIAVAKLFLSEGTIVTIQSRGSEPNAIKVDTDVALGDFPLVMLVNGETSSAAEIVAGALQDNHRALVLGTRSHGKGSVQSLIKLENGGAVKLTTSHYRLPSGRNIDRSAGATTWGINPDAGYFVSLDPAQTKTLLERRHARDVIRTTSNAGEDAVENVTADWILEHLADPQLAAAHTALVARLSGGQFAPVSNLSPAEIELALKRDDVERRRAVVLKSLEQLNQELVTLDKEVSNSR